MSSIATFHNLKLFISKTIDMSSEMNKQKTNHQNTICFQNISFHDIMFDFPYISLMSPLIFHMFP